MYEFVVGAVFKNEAHILDEWIQHYLARGVEHFYLVNDNSNDNFLEIVSRFEDKITLFHNDIISGEVGRQTIIYEKYFRPILSTTKWMAILDLDEFLYSPVTLNLPEILKQFTNQSQILIDWLHFGSSGHVYQPQSVVEGFQMRSEFDTTKTYYSYKSIFKTSSLLHFGVHSQNVYGSTLHLHYEKSSPIVINHYAIQSLDFFMKVKATRGDINNWFNHNNLKRDVEYFNRYDTNSVLDSRLYHQNLNIIRSVKEGKIKTSADEVTLVITSCNRPQLLENTLESFVKQNTYPILETFIIDDSGMNGCNDSVIAKYASILNIKSIYNSKNIGQVESIDKVYSYVRTKWIFHCEEDWEFINPGFIEKSKRVFDENPNEKIYTVWLRSHNDTSCHPITYDNLNRGYYEMKRDFSYVSQGETFIWGGITFNPGLRKTTVCLLFHPYSIKCQKIHKNGKEYVGEYPINTDYLNVGYYSMILGNPNGHVKHIGWGHHIPREWD